jgi:hypothetical protein
MKAATVRRTTVDIDTRRKVVMIARARKPRDVAAIPHEAFVRHTLKDALGWTRREPAPESIKVAAKEIAAQLIKRDIEAADKRVAEAAAEAEKMANMEADIAAMEAE